MKAGGHRAARGDGARTAQLGLCVVPACAAGRRGESPETEWGLPASHGATFGSEDQMDQDGSRGSHRLWVPTKLPPVDPRQPSPPGLAVALQQNALQESAVASVSIPPLSCVPSLASSPASALSQHSPPFGDQMVLSPVG